MLSLGPIILRGANDSRDTRLEYELPTSVKWPS